MELRHSWKESGEVANFMDSLRTEKWCAEICHHFLCFLRFLKVPEKLALLNVSASYKQLVNYLTSKK